MMSERAIYRPGPNGAPAIVLYHYLPGDCFCEIHGLGIAVRHSDGTIGLVGPGRPMHAFETTGLALDWTAACA